MIRSCLFIFLFFITAQVNASAICGNNESIRELHRLYSSADLNYHELGLARERSCASERQRAYAKCVGDGLKERFGASSDTCAIIGSTLNSEPNFFNQLRGSCGRSIFSRGFPNCRQEPYSTPACQHFKEFENFESTLCQHDPSSQEESAIRSIVPLAEEMTRESRHMTVLKELKSSLLKKYKEGLRPLQIYEQCLDESVTQLDVEEAPGGKVDCQKVRNALMVQVMTELPVLRQHQILSHPPSLSLKVRSAQNEIRERNFNMEFERRFPGQIESAEERHQLGALVNIRHQELAYGEAPPPSLEEIKTASRLKQNEFERRDQEWLANYHNKEPYSKCVRQEVVEGEIKYRFVDYRDSSREALFCGKTSALDDFRVVGDGIPGRRHDELNDTSESSVRGFGSLLSHRHQGIFDHRERVNEIVNQSPFLPFLKLTSDDLPREGENDSELIRKKNLILQNLRNAFGEMKTKAEGEIARVEGMDDIDDLTDVIMSHKSFVDDTLANEMQISRRLCDSVENLYRSHRRSEALGTVFRVSASIIGGLSCPFTWGAGCLLAAAAQAPHLVDKQQDMREAQGRFYLGESSLEEYIQARQEFTSSRNLIGLELIGFPVVASGKLVLSTSGRVASSLRSGRVASGTGDTVPIRAGPVSDDTIPIRAEPSSGDTVPIGQRVVSDDRTVQKPIKDPFELDTRLQPGGSTRLGNEARRRFNKIPADSQRMNSPLFNLSGFPDSPRIREVQNILRQPPGEAYSVEKLGGGVTDTYLVELPNGIKGVFKPFDPNDWASNYRAEVLAFQLDRKLGIGLVPPTFEVVLRGKMKGSFQRFISSTGTASETAVRASRSDVVKQSFFDFLIDNGDRHSGNYLVRENGQVISIDHGLSFTGKGYNGRTFEERKFEIVEFMSSSEGQQVMAKLRDIKANGLGAFEREIAGYLGKKDAQRMTERIEQLLKLSEEVTP